ncbi:MAG: prephenate dehydrogenase/arogenate dehydrogenase family protein [Clostridia bacterium]|nr:prephenate dehydrogenase/arogenate dehydrogenase family protein [Clostridia bacterium]
MKQNGVLQGTIVIAGLGLTGGSLALALQKAAPVRVFGIDRDPEVLMQALKRRAIDEVCTAEHLAHADLLVLALPPRDAVKTLQELAPQLKQGAVVCDMCGVKRFIMQECVPVCEQHGLHFIGAHPMAGKEKSGFAYADAALFHGASFIITPTDTTPESVIETMHGFAKAIGCTRLTVTTPEEHDRMVAFTSQLPHVLAGCYVQSPCSARHEGFSASSYRDVSRAARADEVLWSELFAENADLLENELENLIARLEDFRVALEDADEQRLARMLKEGRLCKLSADAKPTIRSIDKGE